MTLRRTFLPLLFGLLGGLPGAAPRAGLAAAAPGLDLRLAYTSQVLGEVEPCG